MNEYVITDGRRFVKQNLNDKYVFVGDINVADRFYDVQVAKNILNNSLNYTQRRASYIARLDGDKVVPLKDIMSGVHSVKPDLTQQKGYPIGSQSQYLSKWFEAIEAFKWIIEQVEERDAQVKRDISKTDLMLEDLLHSYLYKNLNACQAFKRDRSIQRVERKRRDYKDEAMLLNAAKEINIDALKKLVATANNIKAKVYKPRILSEFWEKGVESVYAEIHTY